MRVLGLFRTRMAWSMIVHLERFRACADRGREYVLFWNYAIMDRWLYIAQYYAERQLNREERGQKDIEKEARLICDILVRKRQSESHHPISQQLKMLLYGYSRLCEVSQHSIVHATYNEDLQCPAADVVRTR